jgi:hypothetical protein
LTAVLATFILKIVLHGLFLFFISQMKFLLRHLFNFCFLLFDVRLSNLDECIFKTVLFNVD